MTPQPRALAVTAVSRRAARAQGDPSKPRTISPLISGTPTGGRTGAAIDDCRIDDLRPALEESWLVEALHDHQPHARQHEHAGDDVRQADAGNRAARACRAIGVREGDGRLDERPRQEESA